MGARDRLRNRLETGPDLEFLSLSLGERLGNGRTLTNPILVDYEEN